MRGGRADAGNVRRTRLALSGALGLSAPFVRNGRGSLRWWVRGGHATQGKATPSEMDAVYTPERASALDLGLTASITLQLLFES